MYGRYRAAPNARGPCAKGVLGPVRSLLLSIILRNYSVLVVHLVSLCILVVHTSLLVVLFMFLVHLVVLLGLFFKFYYRLLQSTTAVVTWL